MKTPDYTPTCVRAVLDKPGRYVFASELGSCFAFEVDEQGRVHQLDPRTMKRDGVLSPEGWFAEAEAGVVTPMEPLQ